MKNTDLFIVYSIDYFSRNLWQTISPDGEKIAQNKTNKTSIFKNRRTLIVNDRETESLQMHNFSAHPPHSLK